MANNPGARKAIRKIEARTQVNKARRSRVRTYLRKFQEAVTGGDAETAKADLATASKKLDKAVTKGALHANQAANKKSALAKKVNSL